MSSESTINEITDGPNDEVISQLMAQIEIGNARERFELSLTEDENSELAIRPIGDQSIDFDTPKEIIDLRKSIGSKFETFINAVDSKLTDKPREIYNEFPRWKFYTDKDRPTTVRRSYGVCTYLSKDGDGDGDDLTYGLHMVTTLLGLVTEVVGGVPTNDTIEVNHWSEEQRATIRLSPAPFLFLDPLAWTLLIPGDQ
jgi:hypothetical protein